jgi:hypothetical protein
MRRILFGCAALGALMSVSGCMYTMATPAVQGRAYVVRASMGGSDFWNCDATSGEPVCYQTNRVVQPAGTNK